MWLCEPQAEQVNTYTSLSKIWRHVDLFLRISNFCYFRDNSPRDIHYIGRLIYDKEGLSEFFLSSIMFSSRKKLNLASRKVICPLFFIHLWFYLKIILNLFFRYGYVWLSIAFFQWIEMFALSGFPRYLLVSSFSETKSVFIGHLLLSIVYP